MRILKIVNFKTNLTKSENYLYRIILRTYFASLTDYQSNYFTSIISKIVKFNRYNSLAPSLCL